MSNYKCDKIIYPGIKIELVGNKYDYYLASILKTFLDFLCQYVDLFWPNLDPKNKCLEHVYKHYRFSSQLFCFGAILRLHLNTFSTGYFSSNMWTFSYYFKNKLSNYFKTYLALSEWAYFPRHILLQI